LATVASRDNLLFASDFNCFSSCTHFVQGDSGRTGSK
jgi:hypothetical protein